MKELLIYLWQTVVCSAVLAGAYALLLERRAPFRWCRIYLPVATAAAAVIPLLAIPVWDGGFLTMPAASGLTDVAIPTVVPASAPASFPYLPVVCAIYLAGLATLLFLLVRQAFQIRRLRKGADILRTERFTLVRTDRRTPSFSFLRSVYIWSGTPQEDLEAILAHERAHIRHGHSAERLAMEVLKAILWWNPFAWIASRRLTEVQEYEADREALRAGLNKADYMDTLFRQLTGYSPDIASGLGGSLTKKRLKMMTTPPSGRYALLRLAATLPITLGLVCAFGFTTKAAEIRPLYVSGISETAPIPTAPDSGTVPPPSAPAAQSDDGVADAPAPDSVTFTGETMPRFEEGDLDTFRTWLQSNVKYPAEAVKNRIEGVVVVRFVVETDGTAKLQEIMKSPSQILSDEVVRVVSAAPRWTPGMRNGKPVRVQYNLPVVFRLPKDLSDAGEADIRNDTAARTVSLHVDINRQDGETLVVELPVASDSTAETATADKTLQSLSCTIYLDDGHALKAIGTTGGAEIEGLDPNMVAEITMEKQSNGSGVVYILTKEGKRIHKKRGEPDTATELMQKYTVTLTSPAGPES